ncbi:MAG: branched-chain amino acid ABC transporter permease, partial [Candidatus Omnitrophica bacterium]|nr:branched-chain amino acid ABC transporter permease [Candidatus Omnitrophota bacterium]
QQLANGLTLGAIYALIALGYTTIYGVIQLINFAHGEVFVVGAYVGLTVLLLLPSGVPWWLALVLCLAGAKLCCALLGFGIERAAYRPMRQAPRLNAFITAIGMSFFLQNALMLLYGATDRPYPSLLPAVPWQIGGVSVTGVHLLIWAAIAAAAAALRLLVMSTRLGIAMRATAQDRTACALLGVPVDRIVAITFVIGSAFAGAGGVLFGLLYGTVNFHDGYLLGLKAFTAAVLGGIGNIPGALLGGLVLGLLEGLGAAYLSAQWKNAFAFIVLVVLLLFKPAGLLGERVAERA